MSNGEHLRWMDQTSIGSFELLAYPELPSTQTAAYELAVVQNKKPPFVVFTPNQTAGRGRGDRQWSSSEGVFTATFVVPPLLPELAPLLPLIAGIAVRQAAEDCGATGVGLKWPNDLWFERRKIAGLLCQRTLHADLVGIGVNVQNDVNELPMSLRSQSETLSKIAGREIPIDVFFSRLAKRLDQYAIEQELSPEEILDDYRSHLVLIGSRIRIDNAEGQNVTNCVEGICRGIDSAGRLLVEVGNAIVPIYNGNITLL